LNPEFKVKNAYKSMRPIIKWMRMSKHKKKPFLLFIPILVIVAVSGCTSNIVGGGPGVVITSWEPELTNVFSNDDVDFLLKVNNQGASRAKNVIAEITNIDIAEWGTFGFTQIQLGDLIAHDPVTNTPGESKTVQFQNLRAPLLNRGTSFLYEPMVRVSYDYSTSAQKPITLVDSQELVRIQQQGQTLPSTPTTFTSGPLSVEIIMGNFVKTSGQFGAFGQFDIFPVHIKIRNTLWGSGGSVIPQGLGYYGGGLFSDFDYPILVTVTPPSGTNFVFSGFGDDCSSFQFTSELFRGEEAEITCELEVTSPPAFRTESLIKVDLDYRYSIDAITQINVQGTKEIGGIF